jgi:hypothetical protein
MPVPSNKNELGSGTAEARRSRIFRVAVSTSYDEIQQLFPASVVGLVPLEPSLQFSPGYSIAIKSYLSIVGTPLYRRE